MAMFECADDSVEGGTAFTRMIDNATPWTRRIRTLFGEQRLRGNYRKLHGEGGSTSCGGTAGRALAPPSRALWPARKSECCWLHSLSRIRTEFVENKRGGAEQFPATASVSGSLRILDPVAGSFSPLATQVTVGCGHLE